MTRSRSKRMRPAELCAELHPDDGPESHQPTRGSARRGDAFDRKTLQLCKQVERAVAFALSGRCDDPLLAELQIVSVHPSASSATLVVCVRVCGEPPSGTKAKIEARLATARGVIRSVVAAEITRRRAPELRFLIVDHDFNSEEGRR
ncbi:MAG: hypothetical protein JNG88_02090 [Phycisphaerales bacterium]|nr:hypothetical protein [Phycisphaerales bacterium]